MSVSTFVLLGDSIVETIYSAMKWRSVRVSTNMTINMSGSIQIKISENQRLCYHIMFNIINYSFNIWHNNLYYRNMADNINENKLWSDSLTTTILQLACDNLDKRNLYTTWRNNNNIWWILKKPLRSLNVHYVIQQNYYTID